MKCDSLKATDAHITLVQECIGKLTRALRARGTAHDDSKRRDPEKPVFDKFTPKLKGCTYGSEEYNEFLVGMKSALAHHYEHNRHHPEHFELYKCPLCNGIMGPEETWKPNINDNPPRLCGRCCPNGPIYEAEVEPYIGLEGMTLVDLVEMFCDWCAATYRSGDGDIMKSIEHSKDRFNISEQLCAILRNTQQKYSLGKTN